MMVAVRRLDADEYPRAVAFYRGHGDAAFIDPEATILVADVDGRIVGIVRLVAEQGVLVLRGMHVLAGFRGHGVGRELLQRTVDVLGDRACYCLPYAHLLAFYGRHGFSPERDGAGPPHLLRRLAEYERLGKPPMRLVVRRTERDSTRS